MKKLLSVILCLTMIMALASSAFAAGDSNAETTDTLAASANATLDFLNVANRIKFDDKQVVWSQNGITVTSENIYQMTSGGEMKPLVASSAPNKDGTKYDGQYFRFYGQNMMKIEYKSMKSIVFTCNNATAAKKVLESVPQYPGLTVVQNETVTTITFSNPKDVFEIEYITGNINLVTMEIIAWQATDVATEEQGEATFTIKDLTLTTKRWAYNKQVEKGDAWNYRFLVYDKSFTGTIEFTDDGVAAIIGTDGKLSRIYANNTANNHDYSHFADGRLISCKNSKDPETREPIDNGQEYGASGQPKYAGYALTQLKEGELLVIFPVCKDTQLNDGVVMARKMWGKLEANWSLTGHYFGEDVVITGIDLPGADTPVDPNPDTPVDPDPDTPVDPDPIAPPTGDYAVVFFAVLVLSMTALLVLVSKKKTF